MINESKLLVLGVLGFVLLALSACSASDSVEELGGGFVFVHEGGGKNYVTKSGLTDSLYVVPCTVEKVEKIDDSVLVKQRVNPDCFGKATNQLQHWILNTESGEVRGPFKPNEYKNAVSQLKE